MTRCMVCGPVCLSPRNHAGLEPYPNEDEQMRLEIARLRKENAELRAELAADPDVHTSGVLVVSGDHPFETFVRGPYLDAMARTLNKHHPHASPRDRATALGLEPPGFIEDGDDD